MVRCLMVFVFALVTACFLFPSIVICKDMSNKEIMKELKTLKNRITELEKELSKRDQKIEKIKNETVKREEMSGIIEKMKTEGGPLEFLQEHIRLSGLLEFGGVFANTNMKKGEGKSESDLNLTTVELAVQAEVNEWFNAAMILKYEDPTFASAIEESGLRLDVGVITVGNPQKFPLSLTAGALYVPFGALLTHFPDSPLVDQPMTLILGETREKAVLLTFNSWDFLVSGYVSKGDMNKTGEENRIKTFGFDANYVFRTDRGFTARIGASYISNIADSIGLTEYLNNLNVYSIQNYVGGFDGYVSLSYSNFFLDFEYMTALRNFAPDEIATGTGKGAKPMVWNIEAGYNYDWGRNLEIVLKFAGSSETESLGYPRLRYGIGLNQTIFAGIIGSLGYFHDEFHALDREGRDTRDMVFGQIAVEF